MPRRDPGLLVLGCGLEGGCVRLFLLAIAIAVEGCGGRTTEPVLSLEVVPDAVVSSQVRPLLPEGAVLARSASRASLGLGPESILAIWAHTDPLRFRAGVIADGALHAFPELHGVDGPARIGGVLLVQADTDPAGEVVILLNRSESRPDRNLGTASQAFEAVVVDRVDGAFVRVPALEALVSGQHRPNEIRALIEARAAGDAGVP